MNLISTYFNSSVEESYMPDDLVKGKITLKSPTIIWDYADSKEKVYPVKCAYSVEELERNRQDLITNYNNLRKYPKMTKKDWE